MSLSRYLYFSYLLLSLNYLSFNCNKVFNSIDSIIQKCMQWFNKNCYFSNKFYDNLRTLGKIFFSISHDLFFFCQFYLFKCVLQYPQLGLITISKKISIYLFERKADFDGIFELLKDFFVYFTLILKGSFSTFLNLFFSFLGTALNYTNLNFYNCYNFYVFDSLF